MAYMGYMEFDFDSDKGHCLSRQNQWYFIKENEWLSGLSHYLD